jgi:5'-3' exonuclease
MIALLDGDLFVYRIGYTTEEEEEWVAEARLKSLIEDILAETQAEEYKIFITSTDKSNFRFAEYPEYKGNRKQPKPKHYAFLRSVLKDIWGAEEVFGEEADDALGIAQTEDSIICTIDKDLNQIPGWHYNFVTKEKYYITEERGIWFFYYQLLKGDSGDNIPGCPGIGEAKAHKFLPKEFVDEQLLYDIVCNLYKTQYEHKKLPNYHTDMLRNGRLLKIRTIENETW